MSFLSLLNQMATPKAVTSSVDSYGAYTETLSAGAAFACRVRLLNARERLVYAQAGVQATHRMYCQPRTLADSDQVTVGSRTYQVVGPANDVDAMGRVMQVDMVEVRRG
ncbi:MAG: hypothetical protein IT209_00730 [Armatimonadetes bacterium]|nr:hypothetical protein [Armatimonadota bacterium]